jgi:hypothetical protein
LYTHFWYRSELSAFELVQQLRRRLLLVSTERAAAIEPPSGAAIVEREADPDTVGLRMRGTDPPSGNGTHTVVSGLWTARALGLWTVCAAVIQATNVGSGIRATKSLGLRISFLVCACWEVASSFLGALKKSSTKFCIAW